MGRQMKTSDKLRILKKVVIERPDHLFNMTYFAAEFDCGTVCCALGSLAASDEGKKMGLRLLAGIVEHEPSQTYGYVAGARALGISFTQSAWLFHPPAYLLIEEGDVTKEMVLAQIDKLIEKFDKFDKEEKEESNED
jgi:hypothetical protein